MEKCIFCEFVEKQTRHRQLIFENEKVLAILDDNPIAHGHTLVILKEHHPDITTVAPKDAAELGKIVAYIASAIKVAYNAEMIYVANLGESVHHVHYHLIPRYEHSKARGFTHFLSPRSKLEHGPAVAEVIRRYIPKPANAARVARRNKEWAIVRDSVCERLPKVIEEIALDDPMLIAFHAAYIVYCQYDFNGEGALGLNTRESVRCALASALGIGRSSAPHIPVEVEAHLKSLPTPEFKSFLLEACSTISDRTLYYFCRWAQHPAPLNPTNDEELKQLVKECFWHYTERAAMADTVC